jgi:hypothetical protein
VIKKKYVVKQTQIFKSIKYMMVKM